MAKILSLNVHMQCSYIAASHIVNTMLVLFSHTEVCQCNGNYYGYDCSRCKFGYYGPNCSQSQVLPRRPIASYTDQDWQEFIDIIQLLRTRDSGYTAILEESLPGKTKLKMSSLTLYNLYVWIHHYAARDTITSGEISKLLQSL